MTDGGHLADELAARLKISPQAIEEAIRRKLLSFVKHRNSRCWRFGDNGNGCFRRIDGKPFKIRGETVKAEAETSGQAWHRLIGLDDAVANDRREILLMPEGSKDGLAAFHFADAEDRLSIVGVVVALGSAIKLSSEDLEKFHGRRVRIVADADTAGKDATARIGEQLASCAIEVQALELAGLNRDDDLSVKDFFDATRIGYDSFEANRDLWSVTDLNTKGDRVRIIGNTGESLLPMAAPLPHVSPESHGFPVHPVSNSAELEKELEELGVRNACRKAETARKRRWQLARDLKAIEKRIARKLNPDELMKAFNKWHAVSEPHLDSKKTRDDYCGLFLAGIGKVRVPTGESEALKTALAHIPVSPLPEIPGRPDAPESWRRIAALHRELARQSANGTYFLSCRDAAKVHPGLNKDSANNITRALAQLGVVSFVRLGDARPGGKASEFRWLLPI
jgi:hypothetical protein